MRLVVSASPTPEHDMAVPCRLMRFGGLHIAQSGLRRGEDYQLMIAV